MPELPEVETTKNGIKKAIIGQVVDRVIVRQSQLRWPIPDNIAELLKHKQLKNITRRAKYLLFEFEQGTLIVHLGMSGNLRLLTRSVDIKKHDHVDIVFANDTILRYNDPRRFGCILWCAGDAAAHKLIQHLGPEPLEPAFNASYLQQLCQRRKVAIKQAIMNAQIVVGVGNIYASEALFLSQLHPLKPANSLSFNDHEQLCKYIKMVLTKAIKAGGTTLKDFSHADGKPGYFQQKLNVYGREGKSCNACKRTIEKIVQGGRSTFFCPQCQLCD